MQFNVQWYFSNTNLKSSKFDEHFKRVHAGTEDGNDKERLKTKKVRFEHQRTLPKLRFTSIGKPLLYYPIKMPIK